MPKTDPLFHKINHYEIDENGVMQHKGNLWFCGGDMVDLGKNVYLGFHRKLKR